MNIGKCDPNNLHNLDLNLLIDNTLNLFDTSYCVIWKFRSLRKALKTRI